MVKWGLFIFSTILIIALGGIVRDHVCQVSTQDLGTGTSIMRATCIILSIPLDWIILILAIIGVIYLALNQE